MKELITGAGFTVVLLFSSACAAQMPPLVWCEGCTSAQMQDTAKGAVASGTVYVGNPQAGIVQAYDVYSDVNDIGQPPYPRVKVADPVKGDAAYLEAAKGLVQYYNVAPVGWHKTVFAKLQPKTLVDAYGSTVGRLNSNYPDPDKNVYDTINPGVDQNNMKDYISSEVGSYANVLGMVGRFLAGVRVVDGSKVPAMQITVVFNDGSHIDVMVDFSTFYINDPTKIKVDVDDKSGVDSHNNNVPSMNADPDSAKGTYRFNGPGNPTDQARWTQQMQWIGYGVGAGGGTGGTGTWHGWACVSTGSGENKVYTCTYY